MKMDVETTRRRHETTGESEFGHSEISMSVVTDDTRLFNLRRRFGESREENEKNRACGIINVEPVLFLIATSVGFLLTNQNLFMYWARCIQIAQERGDTDNVTYTCAMLGKSNTSLQDDVEKDISTSRIYIQVISSVPTMIASAIIGTWADRHGRKTPLIFALFGFFIYCLLNLFATLTYESINVYYWIFTAEFLLGCCGGFTTLMTTTLAIITDDCRGTLKPGSSSVPIRIGMSSLIQCIGGMTGTLIVSLLSVPAADSVEQHSLSYVKGSLAQSILALTAIFYTIFFVSESYFPQRQNFSYRPLQENSMDDDEEGSVEGVTCMEKLKSYTSSIFHVLFRRRPGWSRFCICFSVFLVFVEFMANDGSLLLLYLKRAPFDFTDELFGYYNLTKGVMMMFGAILGPLALSRLKWLGKDSILILVSIGANVLLSMSISLASDTRQIFLTTILSGVTGAMAPAYRSFLPRMVSIDETARLLSAVAIVMAVSPIFSSAIFNEVFNLTLEKWAGFVFFLGGCIQLAVFLGQLSVHLLMRPQWKLAKELGELHQQECPRANTIPFQGVEEDRSVSNTAIDSGSVSRTEEI